MTEQPVEISQRSARPSEKPWGSAEQPMGVRDRKLSSSTGHSPLQQLSSGKCTAATCSWSVHDHPQLPMTISQRCTSYIRQPITPPKEARNRRRLTGRVSKKLHPTPSLGRIWALRNPIAFASPRFSREKTRIRQFDVEKFQPSAPVGNLVPQQVVFTPAPCLCSPTGDPRLTDTRQTAESCRLLTQNLEIRHSASHKHIPSCSQTEGSKKASNHSETSGAEHAFPLCGVEKGFQAPRESRRVQKMA